MPRKPRVEPDAAESVRLLSRKVDRLARRLERAEDRLADLDAVNRALELSDCRIAECVNLVSEKVLALVEARNATTENVNDIIDAFSALRTQVELDREIVRTMAAVQGRGQVHALAARHVSHAALAAGLEDLMTPPGRPLLA